MRTPRLLALCALAALAAGPAAAQGTNNYGSVYSRFGLGERVDFSSSQSAALGGAGTALRSGLWMGTDNPALWSDLSLVRFAVTADARTVETQAVGDQSSRGSGGGLAALQIGLPLLAQRLGFSLAYRPMTRVDYRAIREGEFMTDEGRDTVAFRTNYEGNGGLQKLTAGLGARVVGGLSVGAAVDAYFGNVEYLQRTEFPEDGAFLETRTTQTTRLRGLSGTVGAVGTLRGLARDADGLSFGASVSLPASLGARRVTTLGVSLDRDTLSTTDDGSVRLPLQATGGLAYATGRGLTLAADVRYERWSDFESTFGFGGYDPGTGLDELRDRLRIGGGVEILPAGVDRQRGYFARAAYRLGAYTETAYVAPTGTALRTTAVTAGLSLPTFLPQSRFDLGIEAGLRGRAEGLLVRDVFVQGSATFHFGERWFLRRRIG